MNIKCQFCGTTYLQTPIALKKSVKILVCDAAAKPQEDQYMVKAELRTLCPECGEMNKYVDQGFIDPILIAEHYLCQKGVS